MKKQDHDRAVRDMQHELHDLKVTGAVRVDRIKELNTRRLDLEEKLAECLNILGSLENRGVIDLGHDFYERMR